MIDHRRVYLILILHVVGPRLDARYVAMSVLRIGRGHVRMTHLRGRVRVVRVMGGYVLDRWKGRLQLVVPDHLLSSILPWNLRDRLLRTVALDRPLDLLLISGSKMHLDISQILSKNQSGWGEDKNYLWTIFTSSHILITESFLRIIFACKYIS